MGMIGYFFAVNSVDYDRLQHEPELVEELLDMEKPAEPGRSLDVDKAWHGIHFLLTGEMFGGEGPLGKAVMGGTVLGGDHDYGPPRILAPQEVAEVAQALGALSPEALAARYDPATMVELDIYPGIWEGDDGALDYLVQHYKGLVQFYREAAARGDAMLLLIC